MILNEKTFSLQQVEINEEVIKEIAKHNLLSSNYNGRRIQIFSDGYILNSNYIKDKFVDEFIGSLHQEKILITNFRGIGVTSFLKEIAKTFNLPLIVASNNQKEEIKKEYNNVYKVRNIEDLYQLRGLNSRYIICDNIKIDLINKLRKEYAFIPLGICQGVKYI